MGKKTVKAAASAVAVAAAAARLFYDVLQYGT
jgi:hypothetical protein